MAERRAARPDVHVQPAALDAAVARLRASPEEHGVQAALTRVCRSAVEVFGVDGAGMMVIDDGAVLRYVAATDEPGRALEQAQEAVGVGPCVEALVLDHLVVTDDVQRDDRWPELADHLRGQAVRAVLGVPTHVGGTAIGSLDVYRSTPHDWDDSEMHAIQAFNGIVESVLASALLAAASEQIVEQLRYALEHRITIERAVGVVMAQRGVDAITAFNALRGDARARREKVANRAARILAGFSAHD
jgi:GAF domain-containing protein